MEKKDLLKGLSNEQLAKARSCQSTEELLALAKAEGVELNDEQLEAVSGGAICEEDTSNLGSCPQCHSTNFDHYNSWDKKSRECVKCQCRDCGTIWLVY